MDTTTTTTTAPTATATPAVVTTPATGREQSDIDETLERLLDAELDYRPGARSGFISHLAMSLVAAARLGASADELQGWYDAQTSGDFLIPRTRPTSLADPIERMRRDGIDGGGIEREVRRRIPAVIVAPESQFFHAPIRLELAIDAGHAAQVANALENWEAHDTPLPERPDGDGDLGITEVVRRVLAHPSAGPGSSLDVHGVAAQDWFVAEMDGLRVDDRTLDELAAIAAASHVEPRHFGTLHLVTGTRAVRALAPYLGPDDQRELALRTAQSVAAAMVSFGASLPPADETAARRAAAPAEWQGLARAALDSNDPHVVKLVYASMLEEQATGDPLYRALAATQVGR
ncbi:MAG: questin oxidase family protein [Actinomycetota bacterium]|nr:questin oxidase family protein [Actinomycetota bacterium]